MDCRPVASGVDGGMVRPNPTFSLGTEIFFIEKCNNVHFVMSVVFEYEYNVCIRRSIQKYIPEPF